MDVDRKLIPDILEKVDLFKGFDREELWLLFEAAEWSKVAEGTKIVTAGDMDLWMYVMVEGEAEVVFGSKLLSVLKVGDAFGEFGLMGQRRTADVVAGANCLLLKLNAENLNFLPITLQAKLLRRILVSLMMRLQNVNRNLFWNLPAHWR